MFGYFVNTLEHSCCTNPYNHLCLTLHIHFKLIVILINQLYYFPFLLPYIRDLPPSSMYHTLHRYTPSFRHLFFCALYVCCLTHPYHIGPHSPPRHLYPVHKTTTKRNPTGALHRRLIDGSCRQLAIATSPQQEMERIQCSPTSSVALARAAMEVSEAASNGSTSGGQTTCLVVRRPSANMFVATFSMSCICSVFCSVFMFSFLCMTFEYFSLYSSALWFAVTSLIHLGS